MNGIVEVTATSVTVYDGEFERIITDRADGTFEVAVAASGQWLCVSQLAGSYEDADFLAGTIIGQHLQAQWRVAA